MTAYFEDGPLARKEFEIELTDGGFRVPWLSGDELLYEVTGKGRRVTLMALDSESHARWREHVIAC